MTTGEDERDKIRIHEVRLSPSMIHDLTRFIHFYNPIGIIARSLLFSSTLMRRGIIRQIDLLTLTTGLFEKEKRSSKEGWTSLSSLMTHQSARKKEPKLPTDLS